MHTPHVIGHLSRLFGDVFLHSSSKFSKSLSQYLFTFSCQFCCAPTCKAEHSGTIGRFEGDNVGSFVGEVVGATLGFDVGLDVGLKVGLLEGPFVGLNVGSSEGRLVATGVGDAVAGPPRRQTWHVTGQKCAFVVYVS